jgi:outer membrane protein TolC
MTHRWYRLLLVAGLGTCVASAQTVTLDQVIAQAVNRAREREGARVSAAIANEGYLETQSKFHFELRPRVSLLAFSNPALWVSSLGLGMLLAQNPPSPWSRENARLDTIAAQIGEERAVMTAERDALRQYFDVLQRQKAVDELRDLLDKQRESSRSVDEKAKVAAATTIDSARLETGVIAMETELEDTETQRRTAASALAEMLSLREGEELRVADLDVPEPVQEIPSTADLYNVAIRKGDSRVALRDKLETERERVFRERPVSVTPLSASYANIVDRSRSGIGLGQGGFLLGGNTGSIDLGLRISPRPGATNAALATATAARIRGLEFELSDLDDSMRSHLENLRLLAVSSRRKAELAASKMELASRIRQLISIREQSGLEGSEAVIAAEADLARARSEFNRAEFERKTAWAHLVVVSGLGGRNAAVEKAPLQGR